MAVAKCVYNELVAAGRFQYSVCINSSFQHSIHLDCTHMSASNWSNMEDTIATKVVETLQENDTFRYSTSSPKNL